MYQNAKYHIVALPVQVLFMQSLNLKGAWYALPSLTNHRIEHAIESLVALLRLQSISRQCSAVGSSLDSMGLQTILGGGGKQWRKQLNHVESTPRACAMFACQAVLHYGHMVQFL